MGSHKHTLNGSPDSGSARVPVFSTMFSAFFYVKNQIYLRHNFSTTAQRWVDIYCLSINFLGIPDESHHRLSEPTVHKEIRAWIKFIGCISHFNDDTPCEIERQSEEQPNRAKSR